MKANPPQPPFKKGGAYLGFLVDVCHRLPLKNQVFFSPPLFEGGRGGFAFHHTTKRPQKNRPCVSTKGRLTFRMKANPPQPPFKKGGAYLGFLVDVCHRLPLKNQVFFSPPPF